MQDVVINEGCVNKAQGKRLGECAGGWLCVGVLALGLRFVKMDL